MAASAFPSSRAVPAAIADAYEGLIGPYRVARL